MANVIGFDHPKFKDRGYLYQKPTAWECREMGWTEHNVPWDPHGPYAVNEVINWVSKTIWWQDYVYQNGRIYFKYPKDATLFLLRWS